MDVTITISDQPTDQEVARAHALIDILATGEVKGTALAQLTIPLTPAVDAACYTGTDADQPLELPPAPNAEPPAPIGELDSRGIPWDERIHSGKKTKKQDGSWTMRRKLEADFIEQVEAELKARMSSVPTPPEQPAAEEAPDPSSVFTKANPAPVSEPANAPPPPAAGYAATNYSEVIQVVSKLIGEQAISAEEITGICIGVGLSNIVELTQKPDAISKFMEALNDAINN